MSVVFFGKYTEEECDADLHGDSYVTAKVGFNVEGVYNVRHAVEAAGIMWILPERWYCHSDTSKTIGQRWHSNRRGYQQGEMIVIPMTAFEIWSTIFFKLGRFTDALPAPLC